VAERHRRLAPGAYPLLGVRLGLLPAADHPDVFRGRSADRALPDRQHDPRPGGNFPPGGAAGIARDQIALNEWSIAAGGHTRTGLENNIRWDGNTLAPSNAALVRRAAEICEKHERPVATWQQARQILGLRDAA